MVEDKTICSKCRSEVKDGATICVGCGAVYSNGSNPFGFILLVLFCFYRLVNLIRFDKSELTLSDYILVFKSYSPDGFFSSMYRIIIGSYEPIWLLEIVILLVAILSLIGSFVDYYEIKWRHKDLND